MESKLTKPFKVQKILKNRAKCRYCGKTIESRHVHDFVSCGGNCSRIAIDGGRDYLRRVGQLEFIEELSDVKDVWMQYDPALGKEVEVEAPCESKEC